MDICNGYHHTIDIVRWYRAVPRLVEPSEGVRDISLMLDGDYLVIGAN